jgi:hypothetical protein
MNLLKCIYVHTRNQLLLVSPCMSLIQSHLRQTHRLQMGHPWPSHHMACRCTSSCHHHSRRYQARVRLLTQSDRPRVFSDSPAMLWTIRRISPDRPTLHRPAHGLLRSRLIWPDNPGRTPNNSALSRTVRYLTSDRPNMSWTIGICHGPFGTLHQTVRICHGSTDVFRWTVRLYTSPRADRPSRAIHTGSSRYNPGPFGLIVDRPTLYDGRSRYQTIQATPYTTGQSGYTLGRFCLVVDFLAPYARLSGYAYGELRVAQYTQFPHPSQQHYGAPPATYYNHAIPPHEHMAEYSSATREPERCRAGGGGINITPSTHLGHPWEESQ